MPYRIKEYNSTYDNVFGVGKGWIFCTNHLNLFQAIAGWLIRYAYRHQYPFKYRIVREKNRVAVQDVQIFNTNF